MNMKAAASLTGSLLARKGAAYPAAYSAPTPAPDGASDGSAARAYNDPRVIASAPPAAVMPTAPSTPEPKVEQWQDGRFTSNPTVSEPVAARPAPESPLAAKPTAESPLAAKPAAEIPPAADPAPALAPVTEPVADAGMGVAGGVTLPQTMDKMGRVRLSVRLDPDRYLRVKMASARTRWSAQDIVIAALDRYLGGKSDSDSGDGEIGDGGSHGNLN